MTFEDNLNVECTFNVTKHSIKRHMERTEKGGFSKLSTVIRILELSMKDQTKLIENLEKFIHVFNKWKNKKKDFQHEGKCILLYEESNKIYKISCGINISIVRTGVQICFTFPTLTKLFNASKVSSIAT